MALAQRLVRRVCPQCIVEDKPDPHMLLRLGITPKQIEKQRFVRGEGCSACNYTGYKGRLALFEMMTMTTKLREMIADQASVADLKRQARKEGMASLVLDGVMKAHEGLTTVEEVMRHVYYDKS